MFNLYKLLIIRWTADLSLTLKCFNQNWTFFSEGGNKEKNLDWNHFDNFHHNTAFHNFLFDLLWLKIQILRQNQAYKYEIRKFLKLIAFRYSSFIRNFCWMALTGHTKSNIRSLLWTDRGHMEINNFSVVDSEVWQRRFGSDGGNFTWRCFWEVVWASIINIERPFKSTSDMNHGHTDKRTNQRQR